MLNFSTSIQVLHNEWIVFLSPWLRYTGYIVPNQYLIPLKSRLSLHSNGTEREEVPQKWILNLNTLIQVLHNECIVVLSAVSPWLRYTGYIVPNQYLNPLKSRLSPHSNGIKREEVPQKLAPPVQLPPTCPPLEVLMSPASNFDEEGEQGNTQGAVQDTSIDDGDDRRPTNVWWHPWCKYATAPWNWHYYSRGWSNKSSDSPWTEVDTRRMHFNGLMQGSAKEYYHQLPQWSSSWFWKFQFHLEVVVLKKGGLPPA